mmetsp:Transcript_41144/g.73753  ORF Transcript_41144/g.73753 Transcript_41144/m.73753 type:complete len:80 (+) Transcript_41144:225-464(+)
MPRFAFFVESQATVPRIAPTNCASNVATLSMARNAIVIIKSVSFAQTLDIQHGDVHGVEISQKMTSRIVYALCVVERVT